MGDPQDPLAAFQEAFGVLSWQSPDSMKASVRTVLSECPFVQGLPAAQLVAIEGMIYGCRVAEVLTFCLTSDTLDSLCMSLREERGLVAGMYEEERRLERLRLEQAAAPLPPPRQAPQPPLPQQQLPQGHSAQWQPPPLPQQQLSQGHSAQWQPPSLPQQQLPQGHSAQWQPPQAGYRRAHLTPGSGAAEAPPPAGPPPGGAAWAGDPPGPPASVWAFPAPVETAGHAAPLPPGPPPGPPRDPLGPPGPPRDPLYEEWCRVGRPLGPPAETHGPGTGQWRGWAPRDPVEQSRGQGGQLLVRANPYTDVRLNLGDAARAPTQSVLGYGPARAGGWGQPQGRPQPPRRSPAGAQPGGPAARRNAGPRSEADYLRQWGGRRGPPRWACRGTACPPGGRSGGPPRARRRRRAACPPEDWRAGPRGARGRTTRG